MYLRRSPLTLVGRIAEYNNRISGKYAVGCFLALLTSRLPIVEVGFPRSLRVRRVLMVHPVDKCVGQKLRARRQQLNISQHTLGKTVGISFQQVQKYERAINRVSVSRLSDLAAAMDIGLSYFFEGLDENQTNSEYPNETEILIERFYAISNPNLREQLLEMMKELAHR